VSDLSPNFATRFFLGIGHGRALEFILGVLKVNIALSIAASDLALRIPVTADLAWEYSRLVIALPLLLVGIGQLAGVYLNIKGLEWSWMIRAVSAVVAICMWSMVILKSGILGEPTLGIPMAITFLPASVFLFYKAWNRLPVPGMPGLL
jgi:hypothetical protein